MQDKSMIDLLKVSPMKNLIAFLIDNLKREMAQT